MGRMERTQVTMATRRGFLKGEIIKEEYRRSPGIGREKFLKIRLDDEASRKMKKRFWWVKDCIYVIKKEKNENQ